MGRYLIITSLLCVTFLAVIGIISSHGQFIEREFITNGEYIDIQIARLTNAPLETNTLFVGDSALGYAVDSAIFDQVTKSKSINIALTGGHHFASAYNMVRRSLDRGLALKQVIVVFNLGAWNSSSSYDGYIDTVGGLWPIPNDTIANLRLIRQLFTKLFDIQKVLEKSRLLPALYFFATGQYQGNISTKGHVNIAPDGYLIRHDRLPPKQFESSLNNDEYINPDAGRFLHHLGRYCQLHNLDCLYAHAPVYAPVAKSYLSILPSINKEIIAAGFKLVSSKPVIFGAKELGNTVYHVHPDFRAAFSKLYAKLLAPFLIASH